MRLTLTPVAPGLRHPMGQRRSQPAATPWVCAVPSQRRPMGLRRSGMSRFACRFENGPQDATLGADILPEMSHFAGHPEK